MCTVCNAHSSVIDLFGGVTNQADKRRLVLDTYGDLQLKQTGISPAVPAAHHLQSRGTVSSLSLI